MLREKRTFWRKLLSLPSWERGLKSYLLRHTFGTSFVAPLVGAWIEIGIKDGLDDYESGSLPSWERGLKSVIRLQAAHFKGSLPSWERGLKL